MAGLRQQLSTPSKQHNEKKILSEEHHSHLHPSSEEKRDAVKNGETTTINVEKFLEHNGASASPDTVTQLSPTLDSPPNISEQRLNQLVRTIESEIIPRLMLAHGIAATASSRPTSDNQYTPDAEDVNELSRLILTHDVDIASSYIDAMLAQGVSLETIFLDLLAPSARYLGELWVEDYCTFTDVTAGLCRLHQLLHRYSRAFQAEAAIDSRPDAHRILLAPAPGEQHTFGLVMVVEFFRRAGWDAQVLETTTTATADLITQVRDAWFDLIGLSVSCENGVAMLADEINAIRRESRNRGIGVLVGGRVFAEHPEWVTRVGADAMAVDGQQAVRQANDLLALLTKRC